METQLLFQRRGLMHTSALEVKVKKGGLLVGETLFFIFETKIFVVRLETKKFQLTPIC